MADTEVRVVENVRLTLTEAEGRLRNLRPLFLGPIFSDLLATERGIFSEAGGYAGINRWPMLSEATMRKKRDQAELLVERGTLQKSLTSPHAPHQIARMVDKTTFEFGTDLPYAPFHQLGTRDMPQRQIIPDNWPAEDVERWSEYAIEYIMEGRL
jgi:hypothetical protein